MSTSADPSLTPPPGMTRFMVDPDKCIWCEACNNSYPKVFKYNAERNVAYVDAPVPSGEYKNDEVTGVCPTSAIYVVGAPPPSPEELAERERKAREHVEALAKRARTIEDRIAARKREAIRGAEPAVVEDVRERDRRYGLAYRVEETADRYVLRLELPRRIPDSPARRRLGIGEAMPDYEVSVRRLDAFTVEVHGRLTDAQVLKLAGGPNPTASFPPQFLRPVRFGRPLGAFRQELRDKVLTLEIDKA